MIEALEVILHATAAAGTPYLLGTLGEIMTERSGVQNLGIEGMMIMGAVTAFAVTTRTTNIWVGILAAAIVGSLIASIHAIITISLRRNQIVSGLALTMFGLGLSGMLGKPYLGLRLPHKLPKPPIPLLSNIPIIGPFLFSHDPLTYLSLVLVPMMWYFLMKTKGGILIRSVGENPAAADAHGVSVDTIRFISTLIGGALAGLAGAYLSISYIPSWSEGMTVGKGWIVVGLTIFSMWSPQRALLGSYLFGGVEILQYRLQPFGISASLLAALPYIASIMVLLVGQSERMRRRIGAPAALGKPYIRGER